MPRIPGASGYGVLLIRPKRRKIRILAPNIFQQAMLVLTLALSANAVANAAEPALADLGQGINAYNARDFNSAITHLRTARAITRLSDYVAYHLAYSQLLTADVDGALSTLTEYRSSPVQGSPLAGKLNALYGRALLDKHDPALSAKALNVLQNDYGTLPQPDGDFALALAYEALGEQQQAALSYERVYYAYPNTDLAAQSVTAMDRLRTALGKDFPVVPPRQQLERCEKWLAVREYAKARQEYTTLADTLTGPEKDDAKLGIGIAQYLAGDGNPAFRYLKDLRVTRSETDAQRLYYLAEAARRIGDDIAMMDAVKQLEERYAQSPWRLKALITAGNRYVVTNDRERYTPLFKAAYENFPPDSTTAYCHWKVTWDTYMDPQWNDKPERVALLREQVERYPDDSRAGTALYFLGRIAETKGEFAVARAYYDRLSAQYPHYFYGVLGRQRTQGKVAAAERDDEVTAWLAQVNWPARRDLSAAQANPATQQRIERERLLAGAGLPDIAEAELRFGAKTDNEQPQFLAMELAQSADSPFRALRIMKSFSADYLSLPLDKAPVKFWQMLFPLPWKDELFANARARGLDPYDVAALIRQESEFNPGARSRAKALGLMQVMPATGRMLGRQQGMGAVSASQLLNPAVSIKLGTQYLRQQLDNWDGDWFRTLAAYNAGPGRVHEWLMWSNFREPAEFVESIPFSETREYVQAVLRNADIYRELYSGKRALEPETPRRNAPAVKMASYVVKPTTPVHPGAAAKKRTPAKKAVASKRAPKKKREPA
jgi:soluble lytic murein transglycosylase